MSTRVTCGLVWLMGQEYIKRGSVCSLVISSRGAKNILQHRSDIRELLKASIWSSLLRRQACFIRMWHGVRNSKLSFCWAFNLLYCNSKIIVYLSSIVCGCFLIFLQLKNLSRQITHAEWPLVFFSYTVWNDNGNVFSGLITISISFGDNVVQLLGHGLWIEKGLYYW